MIVQRILNIAATIKNGRNSSQVFKYVIEEIGELATELNIEDGFSSKDPGEDGIVGEAMDAIICLVDLIYIHQPGITEDELTQICVNKLKKWKEKS